jgi:hypothetical protein
MLTAHHLELGLEALTAVELNEHQGAALRGALYYGLRRFCAQQHLASCVECTLTAACPVATLVSTLDLQAERGRDLPRPYVIDPPLDGKMRLEPGETLAFGLTLFSRALQLFPYVLLALRRLEETGLGRRILAAGGQRGRMRLRQAAATNPLTGARQAVLNAGEQMVQVPDVPITHQQVLAAASRWPGGQLALDFLTPTRLVDQGRLVKTPEFGPLFHRLCQRLADLEREFATEEGTDASNSGMPPREELYRLVGLARQVRLVQDETEWIELQSYSARQRRPTPISGFAGRAVYEGELAPFLPWLIWGQVAHVGKDAVKGNGWYVIRKT